MCYVRQAPQSGLKGIRMPNTQPTLNPKRPELFGETENPSSLAQGLKPYYTTPYGAAFLGDSLDVLKALPDKSVNLAVTSPPYALHFQKEYGNVTKSDYVEW